MTTADFESLLSEAGNAYQVKKQEHGTRVLFRDRGYQYIGIPYENDVEFLHLKTIYSLPDLIPTIEKIRMILQELEEEYPVVKLRLLDRSDGKQSFEVSAEQFEVDVASAMSIFFRTIDLLKDVASECLHRLKPHSESGTAPAAEPNFIGETESLLQAACLEMATQKSDPVGIKIRLALAFAMTDEGTGTAFCVASNREQSFYVTNAHIVQDQRTIRLYRQSPAYEKMLGTVLARGDEQKVDLAIVSVPIGDIPPVKISEISPKVDLRVALAGYPRVQQLAAEAFGGELFPAIHEGTVTAITHGGHIVEHDALSRPGNSGGPLYDPVDGLVYGVEKAGWESEEASVAVGAFALCAFLNENHVAVTPAEKKSRTFKHSSPPRLRGHEV